MMLAQTWHIPEDLHLCPSDLFCLLQVIPACTSWHFVRTPEIHVFHTLHLRYALELWEACCCPPPGQRGSAHSLPREQLVWKCPLLSEECITATSCTARALFWWHLNKYSAGQSLHHINVLAPQQTTACEITFMLGVISPTADQGTNIKGEFCLLQPHSWVPRYKEMTEGR